MKPEQERAKRETAFSMLTLERHRAAGVILGWDSDRFLALCGKLNRTPYELGRMCCIFNAPTIGQLPSHYLVEMYLNRNHFPPMAALHLSLLEKWCREQEQPKEPRRD